MRSGLASASAASASGNGRLLSPFIDEEGCLLLLLLVWRREKSKTHG
jgi:hypothetical protein